MTAYQLKPWTQVIIPHADIISGNLDNAVFAASLSQVVRQDSNCPEVYRDAKKFFQATYLTNSLRSLIIGSPDVVVRKLFNVKQD